MANCELSDIPDGAGEQECRPGIKDPERRQMNSKTPLVIHLVVKHGGWTFVVMGGMSDILLCFMK